MVVARRDFHRYPELGWLEFRTASRIVRRLIDLGFDTRLGRDVVASHARNGVPEKGTLEDAWLRAHRQGGDPELLGPLRGGFTGVVGDLSAGPGPTIAFRFDIDALPLSESADPQHRPAAEGFVSENAGVMHACGHDGHAALGLGLAQVIRDIRPFLSGRIRLIFQPAEEGVRGARAMVASGVLDGVDLLYGLHLHSGWPTGQVVPGRGGFLATSKFDAHLRGAPAHAGGSPHLGSNAVLAAATAAINLHAIPRHRGGATRINVGRIEAGEGRNVIGSRACLVIETRGETSELNSYMVSRAERVLAAAAAMYGCDVEVTPVGGADTAASDPELAARVAEAASWLRELTLRPSEPVGGSDDLTHMMLHVQARGGLATSIGFGADLGGWGHHTERFDFDEAALPLALKLLAALALDAGA
jgi:aminobenzoyl-glutamate utilization protein A